MKDCLQFIQKRSAGSQVAQSVLAEAVERFGIGWKQCEVMALEHGLLPGRYQRNAKMLDVSQQLRLQQSTVAVVGCGGLGGYVLEELARLGVGHIIAIDPDRFEEHNLNRQLLCLPENLGQSKALVAAERLASVNPALCVQAYCTALDADNAAQLLEGADIAVDALDSIEARRALGGGCQKLGIPMVHGAIAGWFGQVSTLYPESQMLERLYGSSDGGKGVETELGNPSFTPALVASLQVVLLGDSLPGVG